MGRKWGFRVVVGVGLAFGGMWVVASFFRSWRPAWNVAAFLTFVGLTAGPWYATARAT